MTNDAGSLPFPIQKLRRDQVLQKLDPIAVEEPLEIRLSYSRSKKERVQKTVAITMRTPGHDADLAIGFLFAEGIIRHRNEITEVQPCGPIMNQARSRNIIRVELAPQVKVDLKRIERHFMTNSSCGVCGKASLEFFLGTQQANLENNRELFSSQPQVTQNLFCRLPDLLRDQQSIFEQTGGIHASALFTPKGDLIAVREDVGRHNALDKLIGNAFMKDELPLEKRILLVSGRVSFELVQKAFAAGVRILAAVGAPSSLAIELAKKAGMTLIGFIRNEQFNLYCGEWRISNETENAR